jgi:hypothetical protein
VAAGEIRDSKVPVANWFSATFDAHPRLVPRIKDFWGKFLERRVNQDVLLADPCSRSTGFQHLLTLVNSISSVNQKFFLEIFWHRAAWEEVELLPINWFSASFDAGQLG